MKSFIIFVLLVLLLTGAWMSRPTQAQLNAYIVQQATATDTNFISHGVDEAAAKARLGKLEFKDRYFWVEAEQDGRTVYAGLFGHWFDRADLPRDAQALTHR